MSPCELGIRDENLPHRGGNQSGAAVYLLSVEVVQAAGRFLLEEIPEKTQNSVERLCLAWEYPQVAAGLGLFVFALFKSLW